MNRLSLRALFMVVALFALVRSGRAQIGSGWVEYSPERKVHLENYTEKSPHAYDWPTSYVSYGEPKTADYSYDPATKTETFRLFGPISNPPAGRPANGNRSEIRIYNEYEFGSRQFEGYVTFFPPLDDESLFQIWGSERGATQLMVRGFAAHNGCLGINFEGSGTPKFLHDLYGKEIRLNVIHLQEDVGNKLIIYVNGEKLIEIPDNEKAVNHDNKNYHKYGCYGTVRQGHENPKVIWRAVRHFRDGVPPPADRTPMPHEKFRRRDDPAPATPGGKARVDTTGKPAVNSTDE